MKLAFKLLFIFLLLVLIVGLADSQQVTGIIRGTIYDPSGAVVSPVLVTVTQAETGFARTATSDSQGNFTFVALPLGHYRVKADARGYHNFAQDGLILEVNHTVTVRVRLMLAQA